MELVKGLVVPVARRSHLLALKILWRDDRRRPQDVADLRVLLGHASPDEILEAKAALSLITERGFHRGRALLASFEELLADEARQRGATPCRSGRSPAWCIVIRRARALLIPSSAVL